MPIIKILKNGVIYALSGLNPKKLYGRAEVLPVDVTIYVFVATPCHVNFFRPCFLISTFPSCYKYTYILLPKFLMQEFKPTSFFDPFRRLALEQPFSVCNFSCLRLVCFQEKNIKTPRLPKLTSFRASHSFFLCMEKQLAFSFMSVCLFAVELPPFL